MSRESIGAAVARRLPDSPEGAVAFNLAAFLELALRGGMENGSRLGPDTGRFLSFSSVDEVLAAFLGQAAYFVRLALGNTPGKTSPALCVGLANVGDSLAAMDRFVYRSRVLSPAQLLAALDSDFTDYAQPREAWVEMAVRNELFRRGDLSAEQMAKTNAYRTGTYPASADGGTVRRLLRAGALKYGNGSGAADRFAAEAALVFLSAVRACPGTDGSPHRAVFRETGAGITFGLATGATPDGRKACAALSDGLLPAPGTSRSGPAAAEWSAAAVERVLASAGADFTA